MLTVYTQQVNHKNRNRIVFGFNYHKDIPKTIKKIGGCYWSDKLRAWNAPASISLQSLNKQFINLNFVETNKIRNKTNRAKIVIDKKNKKIILNLFSDINIYENLKKIINGFLREQTKIICK